MTDTVRVFVNGSQVASQAQATPLTTSTGALHIGGDSYGEWFTGRIDEVRITTAVASSGWVATEYANQRPGSTFYTVGPDQPAP